MPVAMICWFIVILACFVFIAKPAMAWSGGVPVCKHLDIRFIGVHQKIERAAYKILSEFLGAGGLDSFPSYKSIFLFSGDKGPDGEWVRGRDADSSHYFNPVTDKGDVALRVQEHFDALVQALRQDPSGPIAARSAQFMAHYAADSLCPAHLHPESRYEEDKPLAENWFDPTWDGPWSMISRRNRHFYFEVHSTVAFFFRRFPAMGEIDLEFVNSGTKAGTDGVEKYIVENLKKIDSFPVYERFLKQGWKPCRQELFERIIPASISLVATLWAKALKEADGVS